MIVRPKFLFFYSVGNNVELVHTPKKSDDAAPESTEPITSSTYVRNYFKAYITSGGGIPTAIKLEVANDQAVLSDSATSPGIKKCEAELIQQVAKLGGKFSRSLTGLAFGFLNNVNVSFVIGADFAVGDNKTLMHLAQTLAETWSRRVAEYVAWQNLLMPESAKC